MTDTVWPGADQATQTTRQHSETLKGPAIPKIEWFVAAQRQHLTEAW